MALNFLKSLPFIAILVTFLFLPPLSYAQTTIFSDDFTDVDGTALSAHNNVWEIREGGGVAVIQNNTLFTASSARALYHLPSYVLANQCVSADFLFPVVNGAGFSIMISPTNEFYKYYDYISVENTIELDYFTPNGGARIGNQIPLSLTPGWHNHKLCFIDGQLTVYLDNTVMSTSPVSVLEAHGVTQGYVDIQIGQGNFIDNFLLESVVSTSQAPQVVSLSGGIVNEGGIYSENGSFSDPDSTSWTAIVNYGDGTGDQPLSLSGTSFSLNHTYADQGIYTVTVTIVDEFGASDEEIVAVTVNNIAPTVLSVTALPNPVQFTFPVTATAAFTDPAGGFDVPYSVTWDWGDDSFETVAGSWSNSEGSVSTTHTYGAAGVYHLMVRITDKDGGVSDWKDGGYVSVYAPTPQGLFSAGQMFNSPVGAFRENVGMTGMVRFGLSYKYQGEIPTELRQFTLDFNAADFHFNATNITYLVTTGDVATLRGTGMIEGRTGVYNFMVSAQDSSNTIRIQITDSAGIVIYDTQYLAPDNATPATSITGGNVVVN